MEKEKIIKIKKFLVKKLYWLKVFVVFVVLAYSGYLWNIFVYVDRLNDVEKQEYMSTKEKEVTFDQNNFKAVLDKIEEKKKAYATPLENVPDIFRLR
jgi:hypothetical protein